MGLDSVELLLEIENYFGISIADAEAEKLYTIQDMVDAVAKHLNCTNNNLELRDRLFEKVLDNMKALGWITQPVGLSDFIAPFVAAKTKADWTAFGKSLGFSVPQPEMTNTDGSKWTNKFIKILTWTTKYDLETLRFENLIDAIAANNYVDLVERKHIKSQYEIYIAIAGITVDKIGVDYYEIAPDKSFTNDLGVD